MTQASETAVGWHDRIAEDFARGYERSPGFRERLAVWSALIDAHVKPGDRVLDAGCGAGTFSLIAAARAGHVEAIDGSANMIELARAEQAHRGTGNVEFRQAWLDSLDAVADVSFDVVLSSSVLEYVENFDVEMARIARVLKPGGTLILSLPNARALYRKLESTAFRLTGRPPYFAHVRHMFAADGFCASLPARGLSLQSCQFFANPPGPFGVLSTLGGDTQKTMFVTVSRKA
jgi:ubiquinone/menaquinone biosynthesis C-methylase UbiE